MARAEPLPDPNAARGSGAGPRDDRLRHVATLVVLCAVLFVPGIGGRDLWAPDEIRYAEVAREMSLLGSYIIPQLNGADYTHKPPLFFWLVILLAQVAGGIGPVAARGVSILSATGTVLVTYGIGRRWAGPRTGLWAGIILASAAEFWWLAGHGAMDTLLTLLVTAAVFAFLAGYCGDGGRWPAYLAFALFAGLAVLAKGPVGLIIPALAAGAFAVVTSGPRALLSPRALVIGAVALLVVGLWLGPVFLFGDPDYIRGILYRQNIERIAEPWGHVRPWYYFLWNFPLDFLPWAVFFPGACVWLASRRPGTGGGAGVSRRMALCWFLTTLIFFSLLSTKREKYMLPCYPAAALLLAEYLVAMAEDAGGRRMRWLSVPGTLFFGLLVLAGLVFTGAGLVSPERIAALFPRNGDSLLSVISIPRVLGVPGLTILGAAIALAGAWGVRNAVRHDPARLVAAVIVAFAVVGFITRGVVLPRIDPMKSARSFSEVVSEAAGETGRIGIYRSIYEGAYNYYTGRIRLDWISDPEDAAAYLGSEAPSVLIIRDRDLKKIAHAFDPPPAVIHVGRVGSKRMLLLTGSGGEP